MAGIEIISRSAGDPAVAWRGRRRIMTHTHTHSGRPDHGGTVKPPENYRCLAAWAAARGIDAIGMGSPYTPKSAARFAYYEGPGLKEYYSPTFDRSEIRRARVQDCPPRESTGEPVCRADKHVVYFLPNVAGARLAGPKPPNETARQ